MPQPRVLLLIAGCFGQFLTRLVQNLTLRNDCNLIPSAHGTQRVLSSQNDHWTVEDPQLSPGVVGSRLGSNRLSLTRETGVHTARPQGILQTSMYSTDKTFAVWPCYQIQDVQPNWTRSLLMTKFKQVKSQTIIDTSIMNNLLLSMQIGLP